jgi:hypothetical protein
MELMVSVSILVLILLSVGVIFGGASRSVSNSQAIMDMLANVRAIQEVIARDVRGMDRNGFLVIRSRVWNTNTADLPTQPNPPPPVNLRFIDVSPHYDQISFISLGSFPNRTGSNNPTDPFNDGGASANAAHVWIGQLVMQNKSLPDASYMTPDQTVDPTLDRVPTGYSAFPAAPKENEFVLGMHHTLMLPGPAAGSVVSFAGQPIPAYSSIMYTTPPINGASASDVNVKITSSRFAVAAISPAQFMASIANSIPASPAVAWQNVCYRFSALSSVYDTEVSTNQFVNGYFRTHPIAIQGVSSFKIEWTDGTYLGGLPVWYSVAHASPDTTVNTVDLSGGTFNSDQYMAAFSVKNPTKWPKALRFTYHIVDLNNRLSGGRDFTQVVQLPE